MKIIFLIHVFRWCKSAEPWMCSRRPLSCPNSDHHLFPASISEFKYSINQASRLSQFRRAPIIREDLPDLHTSSTQSFLADCRSPLRKLRSSSSSIRLLHAIWTGMITKHSPFVPSVSWFRFWIKPSSLKAQSSSRFRRKSRLVLSPSHNHCSVYRHKSHKYLLERREGYLRVSYSMFLEFSFRVLVKNLKYSVSPWASRRKISAAFINFNKAYLLNHWSDEVVWIPVGKRIKSFVSFLFKS
jgi:hypothetical protein